MKTLPLKIMAIVLTLFALVTIFMSGSVLFDLFGIRAKEGNYVLFIVVINFIAGFFYLISAFGLFTEKRWSPLILAFIAGMLIVGFAALVWHIKNGGLYEEKTVKAMLFRITLTLLFAILGWRFIGRKKVDD